MRLPLASPRVEHHAVGADAVAHPQRLLQRRQRLGADLALLAGGIDQVDGVDDHRGDGRVVHRLPISLTF